MKKYIFCFILIVLMLAAVSICIFASENPTFEVDTVECSAGETVNVRINIKNNPGLASAKFVVSYDTGLTVESVKFGDVGGMTMLPQKYDSPFVLNWFSALKELKDDVVYATITFKTPSNPTKSMYAVSIKYNQNDVFNINEKDVYFDIVNGGVVIKGQGQSTTETSTIATTEKETTSKTETSETTSSKETQSTIQTIPVYTTQQTVPVYTKVETTEALATTEPNQSQTVYIESTEATSVIPTTETNFESISDQTTENIITSVKEETIVENDKSDTDETFESSKVTTVETTTDNEKKNSPVIPIIIVCICVIGVALVLIFVIKGQKQKSQE